jgi:hypothetical protein
METDRVTTLRWTKGVPQMSGIAVQRFQELGEYVVGNINWLEENGGGWGNDGYFGKDSAELAKLVQHKLGLTVDGIVGPKTWQAIFDYLKLEPSGAKVYHTPNGTKVIDGRGVWAPVKKYYGINRPWKGENRNKITGVMLHQTGCMMPEDPQVWNKINAHCGITRAGVLILMFPFEMLIWHGNGLTRPTIGIEIAGLFKGVERSSNTWWPRGAKTHDLTYPQILASEVLYDIIKGEFDDNGGTWEHVYAHRQSSGMRMSDPGESIWKEIAQPWLARLQASDGGDSFKIGSGYSIRVK